MRVNFKAQEGFYLTILTNLILVILTLGIYLPWAVTNVRRIVWSNVSLDGARFHYLGHAIEILKGYLLLIGLFILSRIFTTIGSGNSASFLMALPLIVLGSSFLFGLIYKAQLGSFRYQVNRTAYKGMRFRTNLPQLSDQYKLCLKWGFFTAITFGLLYSYFFYRIELLKYNSLEFGEEKFTYSVTFRQYFGIFAKYALIGLGGIFIASFLSYFIARMAGLTTANKIAPTIMMFVILGVASSLVGLRVLYELFLLKVRNLRSQHITLSTDLNFWDFYLMNLTNIPLLLLSFFLALPLVLARNIGMYANSVSVYGMDLVTIARAEGGPVENLDDLLSHSYDLDILDVF